MAPLHRQTPSTTLSIRTAWTIPQGIPQILQDKFPETPHGACESLQGPLAVLAGVLAGFLARFLRSLAGSLRETFLEFLVNCAAKTIRWCPGQISGAYPQQSSDKLENLFLGAGQNHDFWQKWGCPECSGRKHTGVLHRISTRMQWDSSRTSKPDFSTENTN